MPNADTTHRRRLNRKILPSLKLFVLTLTHSIPGIYSFGNDQRTGCYGPRIGTQFHRPYRLAPMPEGLRPFPAYLRAAGYYTSNNRKKDYNNNYRYKNLAWQEWRDLFHAGQLSGISKQFFEPKAVEHLYDCEADPHQVVNLAGKPEHAATLAALRASLRDTVTRLPDLSFYPESRLIQEVMANPVAFGRAPRAEIAALADTADLALLPFEEAEALLREALGSGDPMIRYWAAMACAAFGEAARPLAAAAKPLLDDPSPVVRIRAAEFLGQIRETDPRPVLTGIVNTTSDAVLATEALNASAR